MARIGIEREYFDWMCELVCKDRYTRYNSYIRLLEYLHSVEFVSTKRINDTDRAGDGVSLRHRFALSHEEYRYDYIRDVLDGPCSVLEMMIALSIRCEEGIMDDPRFGNRTGQWFWKMVVNLGLGSMTDDRFDRQVAEDVIVRFLNREYDRDGHGGLFSVRGCDYDFREMEIWNQLCCFLDTMI